jgi:predicted regulator of Ras-like GTPase activity (Roadblock/LC7/MglB family)
MDAQQALDDLKEISSQIEAAIVLEGQDEVAGSTLADPGRSAELAHAAAELLAAAAELAQDAGALTQLEISTSEGSVFLVRDEKATIVATTKSNPTVGLVFYDLKSALRAMKPKPAARAAAPRRTKTAAKKTTAKKTTAKKPAARRSSPRKKPDAS